MKSGLAGEIDNCPKCGTTTVLRFGLVGGAGEEDETERMWGVCEVCGAKFRRREENEMVYYDVWSCITPEIDLKFVKIRPNHCRWVTKKKRPMVTDSI